MEDQRKKLKKKEGLADSVITDEQDDRDDVYHYDEPDEYDDADDETAFDEPDKYDDTDDRTYFYDEPDKYDDAGDETVSSETSEVTGVPERHEEPAEKKKTRNNSPESKKTAEGEVSNKMQTELRRAQRRVRELEVKSNRLKLLLVIWIILAVVFAALFIREKLKDSYYGKVVDVESTFNEKLALAGPEGLTELFTENYVKYLNKAYVLFGTYPDCTYYKVAAGVRRDDYDFENDFYTPEGEQYKYYCPNGEKSSKVAIDVSTYQTDVDWEEVKNSGVDVVIVRSGFRGYGEEGKLVEDSQFKNHIEGALAAGLECGVYFFTEAVSYEEGAEEARYVLEQIKDYNITQPIVVDTEKINQEDVRANNIDNETRTRALLGFCETIEAAGRTPMIYASTAWFCQAMDIAKLGKYEFWLAAYGTPQFPYHVEGWQYDPEGSVPGIEGNVDLNVWLR